MSERYLINNRAASFIKDQVGNIDGPATVKLPDGLGRIIHPDGSTSAAEWAQLWFRADGSLSSTFPFYP
ncbi:MAG: hypothetical protein JKY95_10300 [Planctomycetaceae bacterium]|nr:hypothetical protein [Planctomycetaceae bacterium]